jgi:N6-L-threonylcarbamoyladenine synthase
MGSLLVGSSFAKSFAFCMDIPFITVDHLQGHVLAAFLDKVGEMRPHPRFPFLCLTVSGGHTLLLKVHDFFDMEVLGRTIYDAAGEAFDKAAKILGLPYPGGTEIDRLAQEGNPARFSFSIAHLPGLDYSFSGLKTSFLYFVRDQLKLNPCFIEENRKDLAASIQKAIVQSLVNKLEEALRQHNCCDLVLAGGVSANSALRAAASDLARKYRRNIFLPPLDLTTDNAAMIAVCGYFKFLKGEFAPLDAVPYSMQ